jgi:hypothetical protein
MRIETQGLPLNVQAHFLFVGIGISQTLFKTSRLHAAPSASRGVLSFLGGSK